jgi:lipopolysaccharide assembly outer membrane protein LptD (OstA)
MTRLSPIAVLALCSLAVPGVLRAQQQPAWEIKPLSEEGEVEYSFKTGMMIATNGVVITYGDAVLAADRVTLDQQSGEALAEGHVRIQRDEQIWAGETIRYNFKTREIRAEQFRTGKPPFFASGEGLRADVTNGFYAATNAYFTSDDISEPAFEIRARYIQIIPGKKIIAHHATLWVGGVPIFYFPYYSRDLGPNANNFNFVPGSRSSYGPFLLGSYTYFLNEQLDGAVHVDYREKRGVGAGPDFNYHLGRWGEGSLKYYYTYDQDPQASGNTNQSLPHNRQRLYFSYLASPATNLEIRSLVRYQSDSDVLHDFFEREYRQDTQPSTFFDVRKFWQNFSLDTYVQPRVNDFLETVERLPDIRLTGFRQQLGDTPVYYESESTAGYYHRRFAETNGPVPGDFAAARADTYHQLLLPMTLFGWLNVTPRVGGRLTYYSQATGDGATTDDLYRGVFNTGAEVSFKASRVWPGLENKFFQVDGLRHIIEPSFNYVYVPSTTPTNQLPQFDYELPTLRLLPIDFPDYNAIDSIDSQNVVRLGLRNKLQTKRQGHVEDVVNWDLYTDWRLNPNSNQQTFSDVYSDLIAKPWAWLKLQSLVRYDVEGNDLRLSLNTVTIQPNNVWSWTFGQYYLRDDFRPVSTATGEGNSLFLNSFFYRVNENWGLRASQQYDLRAGRMQEQYYTLYRDFRSWTAALTFRVQQNSTGPEDFTVAFTFSLKAQPRFGLGTDNARPYSLLGS